MFRNALVLILINFFAISGAFAAPPRDKTKPVPPGELSLPEGQVMLDGKILFTVKGRVLSFSPPERVRLINDRLVKLMKSPLFRVDSIKTVDGEASTDIVTGDSIIMSVTDNDATAAGKPRRELALEYAGKMRAAIEARNREYSWRSIMFGALHTIIATLVLVTLFIVGRRLFPKVIGIIESWRGTRIRTIKIQSVEILHEDRIVAILIETAKWVRIILFLLLVSLYIPFVFGFFPWTRGLSAKIFDYIAAPVEKIGYAVLSYLPNIFYILVIIVLIHLVTKVARFFFIEVEKRTISIPGFYPDWAMPTFKIVRFLMIAFGLVVAFPYLPGSESPAFRGVTIFLGVLLSLG